MSGPSRAYKPRVLVVDDDAETAVLLKAILEDEGIEVAGVVHGGLSAVKMAGVLLPDVVLMDLRMPGVNGLEATRRIKMAHPGMQVIVLTFYGDEDWRRSAEDGGAFCYLVKGCPPSLVVQMIRSAWEYGRHPAGRHSSRSLPHHQLETGSDTTTATGT